MARNMLDITIGNVNEVYDGSGGIQSGLFVKLHMHGSGELGLGRGGDEFGVEAAC